MRKQKCSCCIATSGVINAVVVLIIYYANLNIILCEYWTVKLAWFLSRLWPRLSVRVNLIQVNKWSVHSEAVSASLLSMVWLHSAELCSQAACVGWHQPLNMQSFVAEPDEIVWLHSSLGAVCFLLGCHNSTSAEIKIKGDDAYSNFVCQLEICCVCNLWASSSRVCLWIEINGAVHCIEGLN